MSGCKSRIAGRASRVVVRLPGGRCWPWHGVRGTGRGRRRRRSSASLVCWCDTPGRVADGRAGMAMTACCGRCARCSPGGGAGSAAGRELAARLAEACRVTGELTAQVGALSAQADRSQASGWPGSGHVVAASFL